MGGFWRLARGLAGVRTCLIFLNFLRRENVGRPGYDPDQPAGFLPRSQQGRRVFVDGWSQARSGPVGLVFFFKIVAGPRVFVGVAVQQVRYLADTSHLAQYLMTRASYRSSGTQTRRHSGL